MRNKRLPSWQSWAKHVSELAANCADRYGDMWVLAEDHVRIVGCTTILRTAAPWAWTANEASEPAFYLNSTVTDPAERDRKLGTLIANWAVDHAARQNMRFVRRDCNSRSLATYYEKQQFTIVHRLPPRDGCTVYALQREAQRIPELAGWFASGNLCARVTPATCTTVGGGHH
ncbi:GNAT family N-acetyltransferase [Streptomyces graminilatus]|uniref:GNAT family N-acetyltransferase n=1 Tax=Streptomyces graminilatus TaxID=1464070 RepID=UPI0030CA528D